MEDYSPLTAEQKAECEQIARDYYWRFESISFGPTGLKIVSGDQGGWPFDAFVVNIAADPEIVAAVCMSALHAVRDRDRNRKR